MRIGKTAKGVLALASVAVMLMFSEMNAGTLLCALIGSVLVLLGLVSSYRPASFAGFVIATGSAALSNDPGSLTVLASWLNAAVGLFIPAYILAWVSLGSGVEDSGDFIFKSRANAYILAFIAACLLSVPVAAFVTGVFAPQISTAASVLMEIAIILTVTVAGVIILTSQRPKSGRLED